MLKSLASNPDVLVVTSSLRGISRSADDRPLSRSERLEIISRVATVGATECSAWLIPMLERDRFDENPRIEE